MTDKSFQKARDYAFLLLKFRLRSEKELSCRLKEKKFQAPVIREVISFLKERRFLDDREFARMWVASRAGRPWGPCRLRQELRLKGVSQEIIDEELQRLQENFPEAETVSRIARSRFERLCGREPEKAKRRVYGYLIRRGFSPASVRDALENL
ncbi:MAG: regulatory protein RecX [Candidatus Omnitrophota bacterium]